MQAGRKKIKKAFSIAGYLVVMAALGVGIYTFMPTAIYSNTAVNVQLPTHAGGQFATQSMTNLHTYGEILSHDGQIIDGAHIDRVVIYPQRTHGSDEKIERHGILVRNNNAKATILLAHGFMCDKYYGGFLRYIFQRDQYNFMSFDFRAHGEKTAGQYCTFGREESYDVIAAAKFIKSQPDLANKPVFVYGFSMGAVASIVAQAAEPGLFDAMILDCPFDTSENVIRRGLGEMKISIFGYQFAMPGRQWLEKYAFHPYVQSVVKFALKIVANMDTKNVRTNFLPVSTVDAIQKVTVPCFFIHCRNDDRVPVVAVKDIYNSAAGYKKLWVTNGRGHFDSFFYEPEHYANHVQQFLSSVLSGELINTDKREIVIEDKDDERLKG